MRLDDLLIHIALGAFVAFLAVLAAQPVAAQELPYQWLGNTSQAYPATQGIVAPTLQCQADFHPSARICRASEVLDTVVLPSPLPILRARVWDDRGEPYQSCAFWGDQGAYLVVNPDGRMESVSCATNPLPQEAFACCKPVPLPDPLSSLQGVFTIASAAALHLSPRRTS